MQLHVWGLLIYGKDRKSLRAVGHAFRSKITVNVYVVVEDVLDIVIC